LRLWPYLWMISKLFPHSSRVNIHPAKKQSSSHMQLCNDKSVMNDTHA